MLTCNSIQPDYRLYCGQTTEYSWTTFGNTDSLHKNCAWQTIVACTSKWSAYLKYARKEEGLSHDTHGQSTERQQPPSRSTLQWPVQDRPGEKALKAWRKYINEVYLKDRALAIIWNKKDLKLATHLGLWHSNHSNERQWEKYYSVRQHILYRHTGWNKTQSLSKHKRLPGWTVSMTAFGTAMNVPREAFPVQLRRESPAQWGLVQFIQSFGVVVIVSIMQPTPQGSRQVPRSAPNIQYFNLLVGRYFN
jgi:hypothetical protein